MKTCSFNDNMRIGFHYKMGHVHVVFHSFPVSYKPFAIFTLLQRIKKRSLFFEVWPDFFLGGEPSLWICAQQFQMCFFFEHPQKGKHASSLCHAAWEYPLSGSFGCLWLLEAHGQAVKLMIRKAAIDILPESNMAFCTWTLGGYLFEKLEPCIYCIRIELPGLLWTHFDICSMTCLTWGFSVLNPDYPASAGF